MNEVTIEAQPRSKSGSRAARHLRGEGIIPGVVYGHGVEGALLALEEHNLLKALHSGAHTFLLKIKHGGEDTVLVKDVQYDALGDRVMHVDLQRVSLTEMVEVTVPIVLKGRAAGAEKRGIVDQPLKELDITCQAAAIPDEIVLNIAKLDIGDMLTVANLELPEGVSTETDPAQVVVTVHPPVTEEMAEAEEAAATEGVAEPEVIGAKQDEDEEEEDADKK